MTMRAIADRRGEHAAGHPDEVREVVEAAAGQAYNACTPTAVLLSQRLIGAKVFTK